MLPQTTCVQQITCIRRPGDMETTQPRKRTREENLAKYGQGHALEARALKIIGEALERDGQLALHPSAEGARADCCVWRTNDARKSRASLGIQLKTCSGPRTSCPTHPYYSFIKASGYDGMVVVLMVPTSEPSIWLVDGHNVTSDSIRIPVRRQIKHARDWDSLRIRLEDLPEALLSRFETPGMVLQPAEVWERPDNANRIKEFEALQRLKTALPLEFTRPDVEHSPWDCVVQNARWQLKLARYVRIYDCFSVDLSKSKGAGRHQQYDVGDFEYLGVQLPQHDVLNGRSYLYLVPSSVLEYRGLIGHPDRCKGSICVFPHRAAKGNRCPVGPHWTEQFAIDLSNPRSALGGYKAIVAT